MYERESTAVEGSVGVIVVCFLLSCITQDEAGRDFGARCACFSATTCSGGGDLSLSDAIRDWRRGAAGVGGGECIADVGKSWLRCCRDRPFPRT